MLPQPTLPHPSSPPLNPIFTQRPIHTAHPHTTTSISPQVKLLTSHLPCGEEVQIDIDSSTPLLLVKQRIYEASGLPVEHQKVMLSGINQMVVGDKRCVGGWGQYQSCGTDVVQTR